MKCLQCDSGDIDVLNLAGNNIGAWWCRECGSLFSAAWPRPIRVPTQTLQHKRLREAVVELMQWGVVLEDPRLSYIEVQVCPRDIKAVQAALAESKGE